MKGDALPNWGPRLLTLRGVAHLAGPAMPAPPPVCARCGEPLEPLVLPVVDGVVVPVGACDLCVAPVMALWRMTALEAWFLLQSGLSP